MQEIELFGAVVTIAIVIMSVVIHEVSHGYVAYALGDKTALYAGRLTLNPLRHLDIFGSVIVPLVMYFSTGFVFGWAKPVPYNPYNITKYKKWSDALVAGAGPLSNLLLAIFFGLIIRLSSMVSFIPDSFVAISLLVVITNVALAIFNLVPIPPLDGSKILLSLLPEKYKQYIYNLERYSFFFVILFILFAGYILSPIHSYIVRLIVGVL